MLPPSGAGAAGACIARTKSAHALHVRYVFRITVPSIQVSDSAPSSLVFTATGYGGTARPDAARVPYLAGGPPPTSPAPGYRARRPMRTATAIARGAGK